MYKKTNDGFIVSSRSQKGAESWMVSLDMQSCNCPKFKFILKGKGRCHHIQEVIDGEQKTEFIGVEKFNPVNYHTLLSLPEFIEIYGDEQYDQLLRTGQIIYMNGKVRVL